jgi:formylglycine-generating enzyme required for sulfatase activity
MNGRVLAVNALFACLIGCAPQPDEAVPTAPTQGATQVPTLVETQIRPRDGMVMIYVPAGQFEMGLSEVQVDQALQACNEMNDDCGRDGFKDEQPAHTVALDAFWIDQTEVTNAQFAAFLNEQGNQSEQVNAEFAQWLIGHRSYSSIYSNVEGRVYWFEPGQYGLIEHVGGEFRPKSGYADYPVIEVSWHGAATYCDWISGRLPTEAEWEYSARGQEGRLYAWGDSFDGSRANYCDASCPKSWRDTTFDDGYPRWSPAGSYPRGASWCGALDMAGNVWEWVNDWYDGAYYARSPSHAPQGPESGDLRVRRGGSWFDSWLQMRSTSRRGEVPSSLRVHWVGFRCAVSARP